MRFNLKMKRNSFKINDKVSVLDENLSGRVVGIDKNLVTIETTSGFEMIFKPSELVKISDNVLQKSSFPPEIISQVLAEKSSKKQKPIQKRFKSGTIPPMEVDLHIEQLISSNKGLQNFDILTIQLEAAKRQLEFAISKRIQRVIFIHGVGEGVLKMELEYLLNRYDNLKFYPANFQKYGHGATEVYIFQKSIVDS